MRSLILATLVAVAAPALALTPPPRPADPPATTQGTAAKLPDDWLDTLDDKPADQSGGSGDEALAGGDRGARRADSTADCKPASGTTGAIVGAVAGGLLGNVIDGGRHRAAGTLLGAGGGALLGRQVEKKRACN